MFPLFGGRKQRFSDPAQALAAGDPDAALALCEERLRREPADAATLALMHEVFATAARYEWMFWDAPMRAERWPI